MNNKRISVITPSFNQGAFLEATIESVIDQNYQNLEYIVIDGGSSDTSVSIIKKYENRLAYWVSEKDNGQTDAVNKGIERASGDIIGWLNSDDVYVGCCLHRAMEYFNQCPEVDIVFSDYFFIDEAGKIIKLRKEIPFNFNVYLWTEDCYHANCAGFFRRRVFDKVGKLDDTLNYGMDYEFYMRCAKAGLSFGHSRDCWGAYRLHAQSKSVSLYEWMRMEGQDIAKHYQLSDISTMGRWSRRQLYALYRMTCKFMIGSYFRSSAFRGKHIKAVDSYSMP